MKKHSILLIISIFISYSVEAQSNFIGSGIALQYNGSPGNYVDLGDVYNSLSFPFSLEAWVMPESYPTLYGGIFASDNDQVNYNGFYLRIRNTGLLAIEFGNGLGSGSGFRRGFATTSTVPLNKWTHLAVICESVTNVHLYFNGLEQTKTTDDGSATQTILTHSSAHASIGRTINFFNESNFNGTIDEVRLWNISRTQDDIRKYMCKKVSPTTSGLLGYWTSDESYASSGVNDNTVPAENGTIVGTVIKLTSGAPIGNASKYLYTSSWSGNKIVLSSPSGDMMTAKTITGSPQGVHVYRVDAAPYYAGGLNSTPSFYYGVFCAEGASAANYKVIYKYSAGDGVITSSNEGLARLKKRDDGSVSLWTQLNATPDTATNKITKGNQITRKEYILNISGGGKLSPGQNAEVNSVTQIFVFPNPASDFVTINFSEANEMISTLRIADATGKVIHEIKNIVLDKKISLNISDLENGMYFIQGLTTSGWVNGKLEVQK